MNVYDVIVVGAGQAGLAAGFFLKKKGLSFVLLDKGGEPGYVWRNRYESLTLFTPRFYSSLPGLSLKGEQYGYAAKNEIADYLKAYANQFALPIHFHTEVASLIKSDDIFKVETNNGQYQAKHVIIATGPFQRPYVPQMANTLSEGIFQIHTADYRNPNQLRDGSVLIVGAGNSGAQVAVELSKDRDVYLSAGHQPKFLPLEIMSKSIFWWFEKFGFLTANVHSGLGGWLSRQPDPIFGLELRSLLAKGVIPRKPRTENIRSRVIEFSDRTTLEAKNVVWATGYYSDYGWIEIPGLLNGKGKPKHHRGISPCSGLYFVGLPWQYRRGSALIGGVGSDAEYVVNSI